LRDAQAFLLRRRHVGQRLLDGGFHPLHVRPVAHDRAVSRQNGRCRNTHQAVERFHPFLRVHVRGVGNRRHDEVTGRNDPFLRQVDDEIAARIAASEKPDLDGAAAARQGE
jgi:hypothetical protein